MSKKKFLYEGKDKIELSSEYDNFPKIIEFHDKNGGIIFYLLVKTRSERLRLEIIKYDASIISRKSPKFVRQLADSVDD
jgi:ribosomal protein L33